ncbi:hypothetical protein H5T87_05665 [bacterium]|nr:hypothetical protein [bacterium]
MVKLKGTAREVGKLFAEVAEKSISELAVSFKPPADFRERLNKLVEIVEDVAPHWLEEGEAICQTVGIDFQFFLAYNLPSVKEGCTSFIALTTQDGFPILHKNRDFAIEKQAFFIKKIGDFYKFIGGASHLDMGVAYFLNEAGLAGACNTGSYCGLNPSSGLLDRHILRLIAERASDKKEALELVKEIQGKGYLSTEGEGRGFILLLLDKEGGMVIEYTPKELSWEEAKEGVLIRSNCFLLLNNEKEDLSSQHRLQRAQQILGGKKMLTLQDIWEAAKDREGSYPICNKHTVSAFTVTLSPLIPSLSLTFAFPGPPDRAIPFPMALSSEETPEVLLKGDYWVNPTEEEDFDGKEDNPISS